MAEGEVVWGISQDQLEELRHQALEKAEQTQHTWRQKGFWLVCKSCEMPHAIHIGNKRMIGEKDGMPILVDRDKP